MCLLKALVIGGIVALPFVAFCWLLPASHERLRKQRKEDSLLLNARIARHHGTEVATELREDLAYDRAHALSKEAL